MDDEPFFSHRAGFDVPEDVHVRRSVRCLVAGGSEAGEVVVAGPFREYENLERLELRDGTLEIGVAAFRGCRKLRRVDLPPSLRWIGNQAFALCPSLTEIDLPEGLRSIGRGAFRGHSFRQITVPSSVVEIGIQAFAYGKHLTEVTLAGGTAMLGKNAFSVCFQLRSVATPPRVIVVEDGVDGNGRAEVVTRGRITLDRRGREPTQLILTSPYLASMQSANDTTRVTDVTRVRDAIDRIAGGRARGEGPLDDANNMMRVREGADRIRSRFLGLLSANRRALASILKRAPVWGSAGGGVEPGVVEIVLSFLGKVEG